MLLVSEWKGVSGVSASSVAPGVLVRVPRKLACEVV